METSEAKTSNKNDLKARAFNLTLKVLDLVSSFPQRDYKFEIVGRQLLRSVSSVGANIIEAKGASSKRDFTKFYIIALKSANESLYWLEVIKRSGLSKDLDASLIKSLLGETEEIAKILGASVVTLRGKRK